ncbi:MAG: ATP-binding protein [Candidatus Hodarchaeota archaeon]
MEKDDIIYRDLQKHLDSMPIGFPPSEDGSDIRVLKAYFTPEEAVLATYLNFIPVPLSKIYSLTKDSGLSLDETKEKLDIMVEKRIIFKDIDPKTKEESYGNLPYAIGFFENQVNRLSKEMAEAGEDYGVVFIREFLGEKTGIPQMRTVPINTAITYENKIMNYDDARKILDSVEGPYAVAPCVCVQSKELVGITCKHDMLERCMVNNQNYLDRGDARKITKAEAFEILEKAMEIGLAIQPGNSKNAGGFCLCCGCCCGILSDAKKLDTPARLFATNYFSEVDEEQCTGCGTCLEYCPMDAIKVNKISHISKERCIGCGVCVPKCPSEAIHLRNKEKVITPPDNSIDMMIKIAKKKKELR